jgi:hypothetical protein
MARMISRSSQGLSPYQALSRAQQSMRGRIHDFQIIGHLATDRNARRPRNGGMRNRTGVKLRLLVAIVAHLRLMTIDWSARQLPGMNPPEPFYPPFSFYNLFFLPD